MSVVLEQPPELVEPAPLVKRRPDPEIARLRRLSAEERIGKLTHAERQVVEAMASGLSPKEVAVDRGTSLATVRTQIKRAKKKTGSRTLIELVGLVCLAESGKR